MRKKQSGYFAVLIVFAVLIGYAVGQVMVTQNFSATVNVAILITDAGIYSDSACVNKVTALNFGTLSNRNPQNTMITYLCNKGTTKLDINMTLAKVRSPVPNDVDNGPNAPVKLYISNWATVLNQASQNLTVIRTDFTVTVLSGAVAGSYGWNVTFTGIER